MLRRLEFVRTRDLAVTPVKQACAAARLTSFDAIEV